MKKIIITAIISIILIANMTLPALAYNYSFDSGVDYNETLSKPTSTDEPVESDPMSENIRRNKDATYLPPPYFYGSGDIPTDLSSLYHNNATSISGTSFAFDPLPVLGEVNTEPLYYSDGSIGTIYVKRTGKTIQIYEGENLENLKKGAGHFAMTSTWDGNVALCGHNRGKYPYFGFVKDLQIGDRIVYTTLYGSRIYEVFSKEQISEYDYSKLNWSSENLLTLITCVQGISELRESVQLREVR